jgi:hypothetical protein
MLLPVTLGTHSLAGYVGLRSEVEVVAKRKRYSLSALPPGGIAPGTRWLGFRSECYVVTVRYVLTSGNRTPVVQSTATHLVNRALVTLVGEVIANLCG